MKPYHKVKKNLLRHTKVRKAYQSLEPEYAVVELVIARRLAHGLTQAALAKKVGTKQSAIARLESGHYNPTLVFLNKVARALDSRVTVQF